MRHESKWTLQHGSKLSDIGELEDEGVSRMSSTLPRDDRKYGDAYPTTFNTQLNNTHMNDVTADHMMDDLRDLESSLEKTKKVPDTTGRSYLNAASKRSDIGLNGHYRDTEDDDSRIMYKQPNLEKVFNIKEINEADRNGLSEQVFENFIKEWGNRDN